MCRDEDEVRVEAMAMNDFERFEDKKNWLALQISTTVLFLSLHTFSNHHLVIEPPFQLFIILANSFLFGLRPMFMMKIKDVE